MTEPYIETDKGNFYLQDRVKVYYENYSKRVLELVGTIVCIDFKSNSIALYDQSLARRHYWCYIPYIKDIQILTKPLSKKALRELASDEVKDVISIIKTKNIKNNKTKWYQTLSEKKRKKRIQSVLRYQKRNKDKVREYQKEYAKRDYVREYRRNYYREYLKDPIHRQKHNKNMKKYYKNKKKLKINRTRYNETKNIS